MNLKNCLYLLTGIGAGAVAGLLYAPRTGSRTRAVVAAKAKQSQKFLHNQSEDLRENVADTYKRGRKVVQRSVRDFLG